MLSAKFHYVWRLQNLVINKPDEAFLRAYLKDMLKSNSIINFNK